MGNEYSQGKGKERKTGRKGKADTKVAGSGARKEERIG